MNSSQAISTQISGEMTPVVPGQAVIFKNMPEIMEGAKLMSSAKGMVPDYLLNNPGSCMAIIMQAQRWGMDPFAVAQKTHIVSGKLGYEAQLVHAVVSCTGAIVGSFKYEYKGEGEALECRVGAVLAGDKAATWGEWLVLKNVTIRNSPLWKTNPKQQLGYLQVKNWARKYAPGAILGVYTIDELRDNPPPVERDITPTTDAAPEAIEHEAGEPQPYPDDKFEDMFPKWQEAILVNNKTPEWVIEFVESKGFKLTDDQIEKVKKVGAPNEDS